MIRRGIGVQSFVSAGAGTDADAQAFITAAGITDATQQSAINTLVTDLKGYGIWSKMKAIYPFVGGTSSTHKWNLKDPRDLDAAYRLVFSGGWTHSSNGALPGVNGYADSFFVPNSFTTNNSHLSYYSRTQVAAGERREIGSNNSAGSAYNPEYSIAMREAADKIVGVLGDYNQSNQYNPITDSRYFAVVSRTSGTSLKSYRNGVLLTTNTTSNTLTSSTFKIFLGAVNFGGSASRYSLKECAFASIGDGLTDTEAANLYTAVQAYQTTLSRNV